MNVRPWSAAATWSVVAAVPIAVALGWASWRAVSGALWTTVPLLLFLTSAFWLARLAEDAGLADRLASLLSRWAHGRPSRVFALACALCAGLTATVSLDGAVVLMLPVILALAHHEQRLLQPLLLVTVGTANAFSLAVPEGNPTNLVLMERLHIGPFAFLEHLFVPGLLATVACAVSIGVAQRDALRGRLERQIPTESRPVTRKERHAIAALGAATLAAATSPWLGIAPWWGLCAVAAVAFAERRLRRAAPAVSIPWRVSAQVAALLVLLAPLATWFSVPTWAAASLAALVAVALATAGIAGTVNNLPASVIVAGALAVPGLPAYASLTGLSVGALATPHGSVATLVALERAGGADALPARRYLRVLVPAAVLATLAATACLWLIS